MCGIVGVIDYEGRYGATQLRTLTEAMRDRMIHRGPDDAGLWSSDDGRVCFGHRRLSIIDLRPEGRQPMRNEDGDVAVTFNGEIYNFQGIRQDLLDRGHRFTSRTDTEILCHLFENMDDPEADVKKLSGMFAFAAWSQRRREVVLARDPFGKKPFYYFQHGGFFAFASELRCLQVLGGELGPIDPAAIQEYLLLQYVHAPRSIYQNVKKLEPGTFMHLKFDDKTCFVKAKKRYFEFKAAEPRLWEAGRSVNEERAVEGLRGHLIDATRDRLISDVPVGAFLSGGNDSSVVVAIMAKELGIKAQTFSIGFANSPASEHTVAAEIAKILGTEHHEYIVDPSAVEQVSTIVDALDEPNGDSSCLPVYLLSEFARKRVTVALSGDGGDEMFGGYGRYTHTYREARSLAFRLRWLKHNKRWWSAADAYLSDRILTMNVPTLEKLAGSLHPDVAALMASMRGSIASTGKNVLHSLRNLDAATYMPGAVLAKVDRMSMQFALEVRSPFLDRRIADWAATLPASVMNDTEVSKLLLKKLALRYLPRDIVYRPKQGFGLPDRCWSQDLLLDLADGLLLGGGSQLTSHLDTGKLRDHLRTQRDKNNFNVYQIWELIVLEKWLRNAASGAVKLAA